MSITRAEYARAVLAAIGAPACHDNLTVLLAGMAHEQPPGGGPSWNPLDTTQDAGGASDFNSVGVKNYTTYSSGVAATAQTFGYGYYSHTVELMRRCAPAGETAAAWESSPWGFGAGSLSPLFADGWRYANAPIPGKPGGGTPPTVVGTPCKNGKCPKGMAAVGSGKNCECLTPSQLGQASGLKPSACYVKTDLMQFGSLGGVTVCMDKPIAVLFMVGGAVLLLAAAIVAAAGSGIVGRVAGALGPVGRAAQGVGTFASSTGQKVQERSIVRKAARESGGREELGAESLEDATPGAIFLDAGEDVNADIRGALKDLSSGDLASLFEA